MNRCKRCNCRVKGDGDLCARCAYETDWLEVLKRALSHEQKLNETLREKVFELETEIKTLQLKIMAIYAAQVDDN